MRLLYQEAQTTHIFLLLSLHNTHLNDDILSLLATVQSMLLGSIKKSPLDTRVPDPCTHKGINGSRVRPHIL